jgi:hypothetical protein
MIEENFEHSIAERHNFLPRKLIPVMAPSLSRDQSPEDSDMMKGSKPVESTNPETVKGEIGEKNTSKESRNAIVQKESRQSQKVPKEVSVASSFVRFITCQMPMVPSVSTDKSPEDSNKGSKPVESTEPAMVKVEKVVKNMTKESGNALVEKEPSRSHKARKENSVVNSFFRFMTCQLPESPASSFSHTNKIINDDEEMVFDYPQTNHKGTEVEKKDTIEKPVYSCDLMEPFSFCKWDSNKMQREDKKCSVKNSISDSEQKAQEKHQQKSNIMTKDNNTSIWSPMKCSAGGVSEGTSGISIGEMSLSSFTTENGSNDHSTKKRGTRKTVSANKQALCLKEEASDYISEQLDGYLKAQMLDAENMKRSRKQRKEKLKTYVKKTLKEYLKGKMPEGKEERRELSLALKKIVKDKVKSEKAHESEESEIEKKHLKEKKKEESLHREKEEKSSQDRALIDLEMKKHRLMMILKQLEALNIEKERLEEKKEESLPREKEDKDAQEKTLTDVEMKKHHLKEQRRQEAILKAKEHIEAREKALRDERMEITVRQAGDKKAEKDDTSASEIKRQSSIGLRQGIMESKKKKSTWSSVKDILKGKEFVKKSEKVSMGGNEQRDIVDAARDNVDGESRDGSRRVSDTSRREKLKSYVAAELSRLEKIDKVSQLLGSEPLVFSKALDPETQKQGEKPSARELDNMSESECRTHGSKSSEAGANDEPATDLSSSINSEYHRKKELLELAIQNELARLEQLQKDFFQKVHGASGFKSAPPKTLLECLPDNALTADEQEERLKLEAEMKRLRKMQAAAFARGRQSVQRIYE